MYTVCDAIAGQGEPYSLTSIEMEVLKFLAHQKFVVLLVPTNIVEIVLNTDVTVVDENYCNVGIQNIPTIFNGTSDTTIPLLMSQKFQ